MTFKDHIDAMKQREQELFEQEDQLRTKRETIARERLELETFIDEKQREEDRCNPSRTW